MADEKKDPELARSAPGDEPRFTIKKWNAVTMWSWDICADTCAICRNSLNEPSIEYQVLLSFILNNRNNNLQKCYLTSRPILLQTMKMV